MSRARSLDYRHHSGLLYRWALKFYGRLMKAGVKSVDFEDVLGELNIAFVIATRGYDVESEYTFTAYLGTCCQNHFNKFAKRLMLEHFGEENPEDVENHFSRRGLSYVSVQDMEFEGDPYAGMEDESAVDPEDRLMFAQRLNEISSNQRLLPETRLYILSLVNPYLTLADHTRNRLAETMPDIRRDLCDNFGVSMDHLRKLQA